jgi:hypothetical protein
MGLAAATIDPAQHTGRGSIIGYAATDMSKAMTCKQQSIVAPATATATKDVPRTESKQTAEEQWVQDALENDEVREALKLLHARRGKQASEPTA